MGSDKKHLRVGIDIGGTFTDIVVLNDAGETFTKKVSSTSENYSQAIIDGITEMMDQQRLAGQDFSEIFHATTIGSNTILQLKGARTGLITTRGFRDVLEIRTLRMPRLYDIGWTKPRPLVERYLRVEVDERIDAEGRVERPLNPSDAERAVTRLVSEGVEAIAICLLHSYRNPVHERMIADVISRNFSYITVSISSDVLPEIKEYERTSTTVINAYVKPVIKGYLSRLTSDLQQIGIRAPLLLMQSNGGLTTARIASQMPVSIIESGPAAGVVGVQALLGKIGLSKAISFDMGGTTAKASIIEDGKISRAAECIVGAEIMIGSRLLSGAGYTLKVPSIDLAEVGAGGGSILWIDAGGAFQVGPQSAGAFPGPVCYDLGGVEPTITDANVALGYINPRYLAGGSVQLNCQKANSAIEERIAGPLSMRLEQAAYGARLIAISNMIRAIKAISSERGRDPREYALVCFGGSGPLFAAGMAQALSIGKALIPPLAGVFSSFGLLCSDVEYHLSTTMKSPLIDVDVTEMNRVLNRLESEGRRRLRDDGFGDSEINLNRTAGLRYQGQSFELDVPIPFGPIESRMLTDIAETYSVEHHRAYGHRAGANEPVELMTLKVQARGTSKATRASAVSTKRWIAKSAMSLPPRFAYYGPELGWLESKVVDRDGLTVPIQGPSIIEEYDSTCVVPPGASASLDEFGNIIMQFN
jgi:N-methylhydantoinase A